MRTILCLAILALLSGCCCPWAQVPENPHYKPVPKESAQ
jgi:hypothetical protein